MEHDNDAMPKVQERDMFKHGNPYKKLTLNHIFDMHEQCPVCGQKFDLEPGFWYGTGYVSYALMWPFQQPLLLPGG